MLLIFEFDRKLLGVHSIVFPSSKSVQWQPGITASEGEI